MAEYWLKGQYIPTKRHITKIRAYYERLKPLPEFSAEIKEYQQKPLIIKKIAGVILIIAGIIGSFLPFIQGFLLIAIGAILLGNKWLIQKLNELKKWLTSKF